MTTALSGTFDEFGLDDVLRLIAAASETGVLRVDTGLRRGRIYFVDGQISFATTRTSDQPVQDLIGMGYVGEEARASLERRKVQLEDVVGMSILEGFFSQVIAEVMVRLVSEEGTFAFAPGEQTRVEIPYRRSVEEVLEMAEERRAAWDELHATIPTVTTPFRLVPTIEGEAVLDARAWSIVVALPAYPTVSELSLKLRAFEFAVAKKLAEMVDAGLVEVAGEAEEEPTRLILDPSAEPATEEPTTVDVPDTVEETTSATDAVSLVLEESTPEPVEASEDLLAEEPSDDDDGTSLADRWSRLRGR